MQFSCSRKGKELRRQHLVSSKETSLEMTVQVRRNTVLCQEVQHILNCRLTKESKCPVSDIVRFQVQCCSWYKCPEMCLIRLSDNWKPDVKETFLPDLSNASLCELHLHHKRLSLLGLKPIHSRWLQ